jgi:hypothetical protein
MSCGCRRLTDPKIHISPAISLALSPRFVTNALLGLSRPVGKGPRRLPKKPSTTPGGAAIFRWDAEANKLYAFFGLFPAETGVCGYTFHCIHWNNNANNNIILAANVTLQLARIFGHLYFLNFRSTFSQIGPFPIREPGHLQIQKQHDFVQLSKLWVSKFLMKLEFCH